MTDNELLLAIAETQENIILPRLNAIESYYTTTYTRYKSYADKMEAAFILEISISLPLNLPLPSIFHFFYSGQAPIQYRPSHLSPRYRKTVGRNHTLQ